MEPYKQVEVLYGIAEALRGVNKALHNYDQLSEDAKAHLDAKLGTYDFRMVACDVHDMAEDWQGKIDAGDA